MGSIWVQILQMDQTEIYTTTTTISRFKSASTLYKVL
jgi:hypothetical protein